MFEQLDTKNKKYLVKEDYNEFIDNQLKKFYNCNDKTIAFVKKMAIDFVDYDKSGKLEQDKFKY